MHGESVTKADPANLLNMLVDFFPGVYIVILEYI